MTKATTRIAAKVRSSGKAYGAKIKVTQAGCFVALLVQGCYDLRRLGELARAFKEALAAEGVNFGTQACGFWSMATATTAAFTLHILD